MANQAVRRCWRFGQTRPVEVHVFISTADGAIVANYRQKEADAVTMQAEMVSAMKTAMNLEIRKTGRDTIAYSGTQKVIVPDWLFTDDRR